MIKRFNDIEKTNESVSHFADRKVFPAKDLGLLNESDFKKIYRDGRKVYYLF